MELKKRITAIVGAGAILDFDLPEGVNKPSTEYITNEVIKIKEIFWGNEITEIRDVYNVLDHIYPKKTNFEMLFHVLEMLYAYGCIWKKTTNYNSTTYPVFAPFVSPKQEIDVDNVRVAMYYFLLKVMDIVNSYNAPYLTDENFNKWYRDFWREYSGCWDVFNLNYDTTIEHSFEHCEDGFECISGQKDFQHFVPQKLWENANKWSTISHLHGCIEFFDEYYEKEIYEKEFLKYDFHDMYKYNSYDEVRRHYVGFGKSLRSNQAGEQLVGTPIITGLRKNDKLNILPFDFYHGHLFNCILKNNSLLLVGYSFGDVYINNVVERMELIHGEKKRIVLIDWWPLHYGEDMTSITNTEEKIGYIKAMMQIHVKDPDFSRGLGAFLCRMTGKTQFEEAVACFRNYDRTGPMISQNGCLMLFIGGFKAATEYKDDIYSFLNS